MNVQTQITPQEMASLVRILFNQDIKFAPRYSEVVRIALRAVINSFPHEKVESAHDALAFLSACGFSTHQLGTKEGASLRRELAADEIHFKEGSGAEQTKKTILDLLNEEDGA